MNFDFEGTGFIVRGEAKKLKNDAADIDFEAELYIDGKKIETAKLPTNFTTRRYELFWKYGLPNQKHSVSIKVLNPNDNAEVNTWEYIVYSDKPSK